MSSRMSFLKIGERFVYQNISRRYAHVISDGRGRCNEHFDSRFELNVGNPKSLQKLNRSTLVKYRFPKFSLKYSSEDVAQHRASLGMGEWFPEANELINKKSKTVQVPPSFVLVFSNFILLAFARDNVLRKDRTVHVEQYIDIIRPLKPEGVITYEVKVAEIIDKGKGTIFTFNFYGRDEDENEIFFLEKKFYEINITVGVGKKKTDKLLANKIEEPTKMEPDHIFEFTTNPFNPSLFFNPTSNDMKESAFSPNHWRQYHDITKHFKTQPNCHGRYYLGAVTNQILNHFANGDTTLFKRLQTRFTNAVFPADTLVTKSWKIKDRVHFETFKKETEKRVLQGFSDLTC